MANGTKFSVQIDFKWLISHLRRADKCHQHNGIANCSNDEKKCEENSNNQEPEIHFY